MMRIAPCLATSRRVHTTRGPSARARSATTLGLAGVVACVLAPSVRPQTPDAHAGHAGHAAHASPQTGTAASRMSESLPPDADRAKQALERSSRHGEWVDVGVPGTGEPVRAWVVYPERKD
jgi:hypothetical protein